MPRPSLTPLVSGQAGWDATVNDNNDALTTRPFPVPVVADLATLNTTYAPADYEWCLVVTIGDGTLRMSDGTTWNAV